MITRTHLHSLTHAQRGANKTTHRRLTPNYFNHFLLLSIFVCFKLKYKYVEAFLSHFAPLSSNMDMF